MRPEANPTNFPPMRRGMLLLALESQFPGALTPESLRRPLEPFYTQGSRDWEKDLAYLESQELIERTEVPVPTRDLLHYSTRRRGGRVVFDATAELPSRQMSMWKITAKGINVVDGTVEDAGVVFADNFPEYEK